MSHIFTTQKRSWNFEYMLAKNIEIFLCFLIHSYSLQRCFISTGCNEYEYNADIKLIPFESLLISIHNLRKLLIKLINDYSDLKIIH